MMVFLSYLLVFALGMLLAWNEVFQPIVVDKAYNTAKAWVVNKYREIKFKYTND